MSNTGAGSRNKNQAGEAAGEAAGKEKLPMEKLKRQRVWVCWKYVSKGGRMTKVPFTYTGKATGTSPEHGGEWTDYETAHAAAQMPEMGFDGIGFVMPEGYFLLDVDHKDMDDPLMRDLAAQFPTYLERSPSGNGFHFYGKVVLSRIPQSWDAEQQRNRLDGRYYTKNSNLGLELYVGGLTNRFATFTGNTEGGLEQITDCTDAALAFLEKFMKRPELPEQILDADEKYIRLTSEDIPEVVDSLRSQKNGEKFRSLFDDGIIPDGLSQSEADASLCAMIAFRTGPDPEMIDAVFRESALYKSWYQQVYGDFYKKSKKKFFTAIADSLGTRYEEMTVTNAKGTVLRDYTPIPEVWGEYNLGDFVFGQPPMEYL